MRVIAATPLLFPPGSRFGYSNSGYVILGAVIENIVGQAYAAHLRQHVFAPAGMQRDMVERLAKATIDATLAPDIKPRIEGMNLEPTGFGPAELAKILKADYDRWGPVIRASGFKAD